MLTKGMETNFRYMVFKWNETRYKTKFCFQSGIIASQLSAPENRCYSIFY